MGFFRHITSALLVAMMVLLPGLGGTAHAMTKECAAGHCDDQVSAQNRRDQVGHAETTISAGDVTLVPSMADHDGCNPYLCQALVLVVPTAMTLFMQFDTVVAWPTLRPHAVARVDTPDRPPNL